MASPADKVMTFVERQLKRDPKISSGKLFERAKKMDSTVARMSLRQFHAKYPLQVKRRLAPKKKRVTKRVPKKPAAAPRARRAPAQRASGDEAAIRRVLLRFAKDVSAAEGKTETIEILANVDRYVADIMKAARSKA
jgi:hypothetical protein